VSTRDIDSALRTAAFSFLAEETRLRPEGVLPRTLLERGFSYIGQRVPLVGPQGIFKPAVLPELPLSITTAPADLRKERPYDDELSDGGLLLYRYRGTNPLHRDNVGLRQAWREQVPLIYFAGVEPGYYMPFWPAYVMKAASPGAPDVGLLLPRMIRAPDSACQNSRRRGPRRVDLGGLRST
jgi:putative restriction endonuclease